MSSPFKIVFKLFIIVLCWPIFGVNSVLNNEIPKANASLLISEWCSQIEDELYSLSKSMTRKDLAIQSFHETNFVKRKGHDLLNDIIGNLDKFMDEKIDAVKNIADYAQFLANIKESDKESLENYQYYDADNITEIQANTQTQSNLFSDIRRSECDWWLTQKQFRNFDVIKNKDLFPKMLVTDCHKLLKEVNYLDKSSIPMYFDKMFDAKINFEVSVVKRAPNIDQRDENLLKAIKWSEPLDLAFKQNFLMDSFLKYQYFASPTGFIRHYPAIQWPKKEYEDLFDPRTRIWYTAAMTSAKDIIILIDRSQSINETKKQLIDETVNHILDTLNDNDLVNIFTITNIVEPLVSCFNDTLVQANEENLHLLRKSLTNCNLGDESNITLALETALDLFANFRQTKPGSQCNQAIMLITEGINYEFEPQMFATLNPVRIFTFQIDNNTESVAELACKNRGYHVVISDTSEIHENVLNYLKVMSRPINRNRHRNRNIIWSSVYADLIGRSDSNLMWQNFTESSAEPSKAIKTIDFDYMITVSTPVYGDKDELMGVAAVDVPIKLLKSQIDHHKLGVNGYAFIITNNGHIVMHPRHRREFENILKPGFSTIDFIEEEILDDSTEPRLFHQSILKLRNKMIENGNGGIATLKVKISLDQMRRVLLTKRYYFYKKLGPFIFGIALPNHHSFITLNTLKIDEYGKENLIDSNNWKIHPDWIYCNDYDDILPEEKLRNCIRNNVGYNNLFTSLTLDAAKTAWFGSTIEFEDNYVEKFSVHRVFLATHSGLTRWKNFTTSQEMKEGNFEDNYPRTIDEDYYKRTVEENHHIYRDSFIYSILFDLTGLETLEKVLVTSTSTIFIQEQNIPVGVVGVQFSLKKLQEFYNNITVDCENYNINCLILDNNAYIILSKELEHTGRFIGDINSDIMYRLVNNGVYKQIRMFDYQAICHDNDFAIVEEKSDSIRIFPHIQQYFKNIWQILQWGIITILSLIELTGAQTIPQNDLNNQTDNTCGYDFDQKIRNELNAIPVSCDEERWLFTFNTNYDPDLFKSEVEGCSWPYIVKPIAKSNLIFLAINNQCTATKYYPYTPNPVNIIYNEAPDNESLPCVILARNNFARKSYLNCYSTRNLLDEINEENCGRT